jgi:hypothetical protein
MVAEFRSGSQSGARPPPEKPVIYLTPSFSRARITASAPFMIFPPSSAICDGGDTRGNHWFP